MSAIAASITSGLFPHTGSGSGASLSASASPPSSGHHGHSLSHSYSVGGGGGHRSALSLSGLKHKVLKTTPIVLDLGESWVKIGFAGEPFPRHILSTRTLIASARRSSSAAFEPFETSGLTPSQMKVAEMELSISRSFLVNPYHTPHGWYILLSAIMRALYFHHLHVNPKDRRVLILENMGWPQPFKRALVQAMVELEVPALCLRPALEAPLYCIQPTSTGGATGTAIVIDVGWSETRILPIYMGYPLTHLLRILPLGMYDVVSKFRQLATPLLRMEYAQAGGETDAIEYRQQESRVLDPSHIERTLGVMGYVQPFQLALDLFLSECRARGVRESDLATHAAPTDDDASGDAPPLPHIPSSQAATELPQPLPFPFLLQPTHAHPFPDGPTDPKAPVRPPREQNDHTVPLASVVTLPPNVRFDVFEPLFSFDSSPLSNCAGDLLCDGRSKCETSLTLALVDLLTSTNIPPEVRVALVSTVICTGGTCMVPGFGERMVDELNWLLGGGRVPGSSKHPHEPTKLKLCHSLQNRIRIDPVSSCLSARSIVGAPAPFSAHLLAWTGGSILGSLEAIEEEFLTSMELKQFVKGRVITTAEVEQRREEANKRRQLERTKGDGPINRPADESTPNIEPPSSTDDATSALALSVGTIELRPLPVPDWSHPSTVPRVKLSSSVGSGLTGVGGVTAPSTFGLSGNFTSTIAQHRFTNTTLGAPTTTTTFTHNTHNITTTPMPNSNTTGSA